MKAAASVATARITHIDGMRNVLEPKKGFIVPEWMLPT